MKFPITRRLEIDAAHRVPTHGSKCANIHGHRYAIETTVIGAHLHEQGEQAAMVMDFSFIKQVMEREIDAMCDHGLIIWVDDPWLPWFFPSIWPARLTHIRDTARQRNGYLGSEPDASPTKVYIVNFIPTAENLAQHWWQRMREPIQILSDGNAELHRVRVYETPNCWADYPL